MANDLQANKEVVRGYVEHAFAEAARGNPAVFDDYFAPHYINHTARHHAKNAQGLAGLKGYAQEVGRATQDFTVKADVLVAEGDMVTVHWTLRGSHGGQHQHKHVGEVQPTQRELRVSGVAIFRVQDGKMTEGWNYDNVLDTLIEIGAIQVTAQGGA